jgi:hypothetical protein
LVINVPVYQYLPVQTTEETLKPGTVSENGFATLVVGDKNLFRKLPFITAQQLLALGAQKVFAPGFLLSLCRSEIAKIPRRRSLL